MRNNKLCSYVMNGAACGFASIYRSCRVTDVWNPAYYLLWGPDENVGGPGIPGAFDFNDGANYPSNSEGINQGADLFTLQLYTSNSLPAFAAQIVFAPSAGPGPMLTWPVVFGKAYRVQFKDQLTDAAWRAFYGNVRQLGGRGFATDLAPNPSQRFYRIEAY